jgi:hypothetical protein
MLSMTIHPASAAADQALAARKNGLKAIVQIANDSLLAVCTAGIATRFLPIGPRDR